MDRYEEQLVEDSVENWTLNTFSMVIFMSTAEISSPA
jgi:hypothetical protein